MNRTSALLAGILFLATSSASWSQDQIADVLQDPALDMKRPEGRAKAVAEIKAIENARAAKTRTKAKALGLKMRIEKSDGGVKEIVDFEEDRPIYIETKNLNASISTAANLVQVSPYSLNGTGIIAGVWDGGSVRSTHQEFANGGRVTIMDGAAANNHSTHVGGTIGAQGTSANAKGMATNVTIHSYDWNSDQSEMTSRAATAANQFDTKIYLSNHSYGYSDGWDGSTWGGTGTDQNAADYSFGQYDSTARNLDSLMYGTPYYIAFWAAGNDGTDNPGTGSTVTIGGVSVAYNPAIHPPGDGVYRNGFETIGSHGIAKNLITMGAANDAVTSGTRDPSKSTLTSFSSTGPCDDGRIKPDLVANGASLTSSSSSGDTVYATMSGTSMASPNATGSAVLVIDQYKRLFNSAMRASTLKGLLIHTATDIGNPGPDYKYGWGLVDTKKAVDLIKDHSAYPLKTRIIEDQVTTSITTRTHSFLWDGASPLRATACWTDPAGTSTTAHDSRTARLVNNLNLKLIAPNGTEYFPYVMPFVGTWTVASMSQNATTGINNTDNVETVLIQTPGLSGTWQAVVSYTGALTNNIQTYGLVLSGTADTPNTVNVISPNGGETFYRESSYPISWASNVSGNVSIELLKGGTLHSVLSADEANDGSFKWAVPSSLTLASDYAVRISSVSNSSYTDTSASTFSVAVNPWADALDTTGIPWESPGAQPWFSQSTTTNDGVDAVQSGAIDHDGSSVLEATITGPGTLTFWWKVSSESGYDFLRFYLNGVEQTGSLAKISGNVNWVQKTVSIPSGAQAIQWTYSKDGSVVSGSDAAWVDQVVFTPAAASEIAVEQPVGTNLVDGSATIDSGSITLGSSSSPITVTIKNSGTTDLTGLVLSKDGTHNADYTLGSLGATTVVPGGSTTFTVTFAPGATGSRTAAVHIASNDADENPFDIALTGTGIPLGTLVVTPAGNLTSSGSYGGSFSPSSQVYTLTNSGSTSINWTAAKTAAWVDLSATSGTLAAGANTTVTVAYNSNANALAIGSYSDTVTFTNTTNANGNTTRGVALNVNGAAATVNLSNLLQTYDGSPKPITVATTPAGLSNSVTYAGSATVPTNAGTYAVVATVTDPNYTGSASGSLTIQKAAQTINFAALDPVLDSVPSITLTATASSGLAVSYNSSNSAVATVSGSTVTIVGLGTSTITASQAGDTNYNAATSVPQTLTVVRSNPLAVTGGTYKVLIGQSLSLNGSASLSSYGETITTHEWDLNNDNTFGDATGATPASIPFATLTSSWGMIQGLNTIQLKVTDSSNKTSTVSTTVELVLSLTWDANGTTAGQTNGAGAWLGTNLWWDGAANQTWSSASNATFGGPNTAGGAVTLASPTSVNAITFNQFTGTYTLGTAAQTLTINGGINKNSGAGIVSFASPLTLGAPQTWTNNSSTDLNATAALNNGGHTLTVGGSGALTLSAANSIISGAGGITMNGTGRLQLGAGSVPVHTYSGTTTLNAGVTMVSSNNLGTGNLTMNGGVIESYWNTNFIRPLGSGNGQVQLIGGSSGFSLNGNTGMSVILGNNAANEAVWGSAVFNPSIFVLQTSASQSASSVNFQNKLDLNGATRTIQVGGGTTGAASATISGIIRTSTGTAGLTKTGSGLLILSAANTYNGDTTISGGSLQIGNNSAGSLGNGTYNNPISIAGGSNLRIFSTANQTLSGVISGGGGLVKAYAGSLTLANSNTYTGKTSLTPQTTAGAGTVIVSSFNSVVGGTSSSSLGAPTTVSNGTVDFGNTGIQGGATLRYTGTGETTDRVINFLFNGTGATKTLDASGAGLLKFTSTFTGSGSTTNDITLQGTSNGEITGGLPFAFRNLTKSGNNTWTLGGSVGATAAITISGGSLTLGASNVLSNTAPVSIGAANLNAATFSDTLGNLDVTAASTINLGAGAALAFADSSAIDWTGGTLNLTGTFVPGSSLRFGTSSTGLTATQLTKITAAGFGPFILNANGYLTVDITPPTLAGNNFTDSNGGGSVLTNTLVTYTVTFSEDMNAATVSAADFGNAGSSSINIGIVIETTPGVFTVPVTPTSAGSLQLQVNTGAVLTDVVGNALNTASAIADDTLITVTPPNTAPVANAQSTGTAEDTAIPITLSATDGESNPLTYSVISGPTNGTLSGSAPNLIYTPAANYHGSNSFTFKANDGLLDSAPATVDITVTPVNDAPVATAQNVTTAEDTALPITLSGTDIENSAMTVTVVTPPANGTLSGTVPNLTYTPATNSNGPDGFTFTVNDGLLDSVPVNVVITVTQINDTPVAAAQSATTAEDSALPITLVGTDVDLDTLTYTIVTPPTNGTLSGSAPNITYTPSANTNGADSFTFKVNDGMVDSPDATVSLTVTATNDAPVAAAQSVNTSEDTALPITLTGTDVENSTLSYTIVAQPASGTLSGTAPNVTYTPAADFNGVASFTFKVNDGTDDSAIATISINVTPVNDAPVAASQSATTEEDTVLPITLAGTDVDLDTLSFTIVSPPANGALSGTAPNVTYTPNSNTSGSDSFTFIVNDGTVDSPLATVSLTVTASNDAPVATAQSATTSEDTALPITLAGSDVENSALSYTIVTPPTNGILSGIAPNLTYTPASNSNGTDGFTFIVNDGTTDSLPATVSITVTSVNDTPVASALDLTTAEDNALPITLSGADIENSTLTYSIVTPPTNGILSGIAPNLTYTPSANTNGPDSFSFTVNDGTIDSAPATVTLTVTASNDAPVATAQSVTTAEDIALPITLAGSDVDNGTLTYTIVTSPTNGTLSGTAPDLTYTPSANSNGTDSFTFIANDGLLDSVAATVDITVTPVNDAPVAAAQSTSTAEDTALPITLAGSDVENSTLGFAIVTPPGNGTLSGTAPNLTYTPAANFSGPDSFTFTVNDGSLDSAPATVTLTVSADNDAPVALAQSITTNEDTALPITLTGADSENSALTYTIVAQPASGTLSGSAPNVTYTPSANTNGADSFTFKVNDGTLDSSTATVSITVSSVNDAPVFTTAPIIAAAATESIAYTGQTIAGSATDADAGDSITYSKVSGPAWLSVASNGALSGTPGSGTAGLNTFTVRATDSSSAITAAILEITVTGLPLPWTSGTIGSGNLAGSATFNTGTFTQAGSGIIGGTADKLRFTYQTLTGDGEIIAKISALQNTGSSSRVGVMIRDTLATNSKQIFMGMTGSNAYRWTRRTATGGSTTSSNSSTGTVPNTWLRLVRSGTTITAYKSTNGTSWTTVGSTNGTTFASTCYIGLAVGSGSDSTLNTSQLSSVSVTP